MARDQYLARKAAEKVVVDYEVRTPVATTDEALKPDAPQIHPKGNLLSKSAIVRGNPDEAFAKAAHVVEDTFQTQRIEHMFLEPESCIAMPVENDASHSSNGNGAMNGSSNGKSNGYLNHRPGSKLKVLSQGQGIFDDQRQIASVLGWPREQIDVELVQTAARSAAKKT